MSLKPEDMLDETLYQIHLRSTLVEIFDITAGELVETEQQLKIVSSGRILGVTERTDHFFEDVERLCCWIYFLYFSEGRFMHYRLDKPWRQEIK